MKAVESFVWTGVLPTARTHSVAVATTASSVRIVRATSTSFIRGTGLKKWSPRTSRSRPRPRLTSSALASTKRTGNPAWAATWTMPAPMRPQPITPTFLMVMSVSPSRRRLVARATTRQGRRLVVGRPRGARIPHGHRHGAGASAATGAAIGLRCAVGGARWRTVLSERLIERRHAWLDGLREDAEDHRRADRRLRLLGGGAGRPGAERQEGAGQERGATAHESDPCRDSHL